MTDASDAVGSHEHDEYVPDLPRYVPSMDQLEHAFAATGNPVYAFLALSVVTRQEPLAIPNWLLSYLRSMSDEVMRLVISHTVFIRPLPRSEDWARALGLVTNTWNAAAAYRQAAEESWSLKAYNRQVRLGRPAGEVVESLAAEWKQDSRSMQRRLARARRVFGIGLPISERPLPRRPKRTR